MELKPFSCVIFCLHGVVLCLRLQWFFLGHLALALSFVFQFGGTFPMLQIHKSKVSLLPFKFLLGLDNVLTGEAKRGYVQKLHLVLDVLV